MEHKNKEKLDWIIASNIDKGINLQTVYGTYLEIKSDVYDDTELLELPDHGGILRFAK